MNICVDCFGDPVIKLHILINNPVIVDHCTLCDGFNVDSVDARILLEFVAPTFNLYRECVDDGAQRIWYWLKNDWKLLERVPDDRCCDLFSYMYPEQSLDSKRFLPRLIDDSKVLLWNDFKRELRHVNRFFPLHDFGRDQLERLFVLLAYSDDLTRFQRARISVGEAVFAPHEMGKPPPEKAKNGRANPTGISYLYTASDVETAIAEVRPQIGDRVCVVEFEAIEAGNSSRKLHLLDLRNPRRFLSPFEFEDEEELELVYVNLEFLTRLGDELSKPIRSRDADLDYLASQYLCELVKHQGFDGIVYESSVGPGENFAFFTEEKLRMVGEIRSFTIDAVRYSHHDSNS